MRRRGPFALWVGIACAGLLPAQADTPVSSDRLCHLQDRGELDVATVLAALRDADADVGATAAAIVRHEWATLPSDLLDPLLRQPAGIALLREFAVAPRPAAAAWVAAWLDGKPGVTRDQRCLALAARGTPLTAADGTFVLETLVSGEGDEGAHLAAALLPAAIADGLIGRMHASLLQPAADPDALAPILDRLSPRGVQALLGLVVTLPAGVAEPLAARFAIAAPEAFAVRVAAALDGEIPLDTLWLRRAGKLLDRPARVARVLATLRDDALPAARRDAAFAALLDARCVDGQLLDWAEQAADEIDSPVQQILRAAIDELPPTRLVAWLSGSPRRGAATAGMLQHRAVLGAELERTLVERLAAGGTGSGAFAEAAAATLARRGNAAAIVRVWPLLRTAPTFDQLVEVLGRRDEPALTALLRGELAAAPPAPTAPAALAHRQDVLHLQLARAGDAASLAALVARAPQLEPLLLQRCAQALAPLAEPSAIDLLDAAAGAEVEQAAALLAWAATARSERVTQRLLALAQSDAAPEILDVVFGALAAGDGRARLADELRAAWAAGPLPERLESACFAVVAATPAAPSTGDLHLLAELMLLAPLADAAREHADAERWPDGHGGFPLVQAIARALRGATPAAAQHAFEQVVAVARQDARHRSLSRQRFGVLWQALAAAPEVQRAVGAATGAFVLSLPDEPPGNDGPAQWFGLQAAAAAGDAAAAKAFAHRAVAALLRRPEARAVARRFVGERDAGAGVDPWAALAAEPWRWAAALAIDAPTRAVAVAMVREFAGYDAVTRAWCDSSEDTYR